jgi:putative transposase
MPRTARASVGGECYHVISRGNARARVFHDPPDYELFVTLLERACRLLPMEVFAYCIMPNHFHLVLRPENDGDLGHWMRWLLTAHVRRHHLRYGSSGRIWQGRFKAFPIQEDTHLLTVVRYVERNALRAHLVTAAQDWQWCSLARRMRAPLPGFLASLPLELPSGWVNRVNAPETTSELEALRCSVNRGRPFGAARWVRSTVARLGLESSMRARGRPPRGQAGY